MRTFILFCMMMMVSFSYAAMIQGSSSLLTEQYANQLEQWLGEGPITLTRIFSKSVDGASSNAFHNKVDGQGRTFSVIHVSGNYNEIIGGYNPFSWNTSSSYTVTSDRSAFIFNLTENRKFTQTGYHYPGYQTYNHSSYGPTFGAAHEIYVDSTLNSGYVLNHFPSSYPNGYNTYGNGTAMNLLGDQYYYSNGVYQGNNTHAYSYNLVYGNIEVFTISNGVVPEPSSVLLMCLSLVAAYIFRKK